MVIIPISGIIADFEYENESNVTPDSLRKSLTNAKNDDVLITINSPGGSVFHGFEMFSLIKNYKGKTETRIISLAASMGSVLALAGQKKSIEKTAMYYIHNAWGIAIGDYRDLEKEAKWLRDISDLIAGLYADNTVLNRKKAQELMDQESQFYGDELEELGFVSVESSENITESDAKLNIGLIMDNWENEIGVKITPENYRNSLKKAAASISSKKYNFVNIPASAGKDNQTEVNMNLEQFKKDHPELYAQVVQIGIDQETDRVKAHLTLAKQANCLDIAVKHIEDGSKFNNSVTAEYMAAGMKNNQFRTELTMMLIPAAGKQAMTIKPILKLIHKSFL